MRRAALLAALITTALAGCNTLMPRQQGTNPDEQLEQGIAALRTQRYPAARGYLEPLYLEHWTLPVGQRAMLALIAAELDGRNPERRLWAGADLASRLLNVPAVEPWIVPIAESYYLLAVELGAQEERLARADSARVAAESRARSLSSDRPTVPQQLAALATERDAAKRRADQAETNLATKDRELRETKAELERIKKIIKP
jgi:hypothetical protein